MVTQDYLRTIAPGETLTRVGKGGHAFVLIGDLDTEPHDQIVVADPWPTCPQACLWEDHFEYPKSEDGVPEGEVESTKSKFVADGVNRRKTAKKQVKFRTKKTRAKDLRLGEEEVEDMLEEAGNDVWNQRETTLQDDFVFYFDPEWSEDEHDEAKLAFAKSLEAAQHLGPKARKKL